MDAVRQWAFSVCAAMVACGLARMLLPKAGMEAIFRVAVSVFFLCCLLSPVALTGSGIALELEEAAQSDIDRRAERLTGEAERQASRDAELRLKKIVEEKLAVMGINYRSVAININTNGQSEKPADVKILLGPPGSLDYEALRRKLADELGMEVEMEFAHEQEG